MNLNHVIKRRTELIESDTQRMFELMSMNYENYQKVNFETDLLEKDGVLIIYDENLVLQGFSTYKLIETEFENQQICAIYSGDTILNQQLWGSFASFKAFGFLLQTILTQHSGLLYWFLISKGHRTYLFLPLFFHRFYPNFRESTPDFESGLIQQMAKMKFGDLYNSTSGIIQSTQDCLKPDLAEIPDARQSNRHIMHFLKLNPDYVKGYELPCIAELTKENLTSYGKRFVDIL